MDSYRTEARSTVSIELTDEDKEIEPVPATAGGRLPEVETDKLSNIIKTFNELFGHHFPDPDKASEVIAVDIPQKVQANVAYQNAMQNSDKDNARIEHDKALQKAILDLMGTHTELFKQFSDNPQFRKFVSDTVFQTTYQPQPPPA
jgi:type I restriction enzyme R subunit